MKVDMPLNKETNQTKPDEMAGILHAMRIELEWKDATYMNIWGYKSC